MAANVSCANLLTLIEVNRRLLTVNGSVRCRGVNSNMMKNECTIDLKSDCVNISCRGTDEKLVFDGSSSTDLEFILGSLKTYPSACTMEETYFWKARIKYAGSPSVDHYSYSTIEEVDAIGHLQQPRIHCKACRRQILETTTTFSRVLMLPSDHWQECAENWLCHDRDKTTEMLIRRKILPRRGDCLVGELIFTVNGADLEEECLSNLRQNNDTFLKPTSFVLACQHCGSSLGHSRPGDHVDGDCLTFWKDKVLLTSLHQNVDVFSCYSNPLLVASNLLRRRCQQDGHHQFIINAVNESDEMKPSLLLWIMMTDIELATNISDDVDNPIGTGVFKCRHCIKLLFQSRFNNTFNVKTAKMWTLSMVTEVISFPVQWCQQLHDHLNSSSALLPKGQRAVDGFQVGYLNT